jgi:hypothetical protein
MRPSRLFVEGARQVMEPYQARAIDIEYTFNFDFGAYKVFIAVAGMGDWKRLYTVALDAERVRDQDEMIDLMIRAFKAQFRRREIEPEENFKLGEN